MKRAQWEWGCNQQKSFETLKNNNKSYNISYVKNKLMALSCMFYELMEVTTLSVRFGTSRRMRGTPYRIHKADGKLADVKPLLTPT
ncbi:hypothetical protein CEXT_154711 [Caerostris extrusa]|uniref:Uncharacterized protein n=1 Tax=Caerostris extrusa TaxID=172846 RepID=A0AAV4M8K5_CAEEX|nr:hypothetical protein CEXT_154711 [Caerostris extrusa]